MPVLSLGQEDPLEKEIATRSSVLAWEIPWTEGPGELQAIGLHRVGHDEATEHAHTHTHTQMNVMVGFLGRSVVKKSSC